MKVVTMILGVLLTIGGFLCVFMPGRTFLSSGWALGFMLLVSGINMIAVYVQNKKQSSAGSLIGGIVIALLGIFTMASLPTRLLTDMFIAYAFGVGLLIYGIFQITASMKAKKNNMPWGVALTFGILNAILGIYSFFHPVVTALAIGMLIAFVIITQGFNLIALGASMGQKAEK